MSERSIKRVYKSSALDAWLDRLCINWEKPYNKEELNSARSLYRKGSLAEIEISESEIVTTIKKGKDITYSIVEWCNGDFKIRSSMGVTPESISIAIAGVYELEELLAEELPFLEPRAYQVKIEETTAEETETRKSEQKVQPARDPYQLEIHLKNNHEGLYFKTQWLNENSPVKVNHENLIPEEKELWVRLAGMLHSTGFRYEKLSDRYILRNLQLSIEFVQVHLRHWKKDFKIHVDPEVDLLHKGVQPISVEALAKKDAEKGFQLDWNFSTEEHTLQFSDAKRLFNSNIQTIFVRNVGAIKIKENQKQLLAQWKTFTQKNNDGTWPEYILFSLLHNKDASVNIHTTTKSWLDHFHSQETENIDDGLLRDYQLKSIQWFHNLHKNGCRGLLADEMGLGKTIQLLSLIKHHPLKDRKHLVVCPASVVPVWQNEIAKHFPSFNSKVLKSNNPFNSDADGTIWISSYSQLRRHKNLLEENRFGYAIIDEAQTIKNPDSKAAQACFNIQADYRIAATGTPLENKHLDLWTLFRYLMPGLLGNRKEFEENFTSSPKSEQRLRQQIQPFVLRRTKQEVAKELPQKLEIDLVCPMTDKQIIEYKKLTEDAFENMQSDLNTVQQKQGIHFFALLTRLRQASCDASLLPWVENGPFLSGKIQILCEKLHEIQANKKKVVIFSQFVSLLANVKEQLAEEFPELKVYELTGKTRDRASPVEQFQNNDEASIILVSLKAGGTGITLHSADYLFLLDPWWNPAVEQQAIDRIHRIGQTKQVMIFRMYAQGTIENRIRDLKNQKMQLFSNLLDETPDISNLKKHYKTLKALTEYIPENGGKP